MDIVKLNITRLNQAKLTGLQTRIFLFMLSQMDESNEVSFRRRDKLLFLDENETTNSSFNNQINTLIEAGLISRIVRGEYLIDKEVLGL